MTTASFENAREYIQLADHILTRTYGVIKDPKLLLAVVENTVLALECWIAAASLERPKSIRQARKENHAENRAANATTADFDLLMHAFKKNVAKKCSITLKELKFITDLCALVEDHKKSEVEFARKDAYVICRNGYDVSIVSYELAHAWLVKAKQIGGKIEMGRLK